MSDHRVMDMTKGSPVKLLLQFATPLFLGNLLQQFYNIADTSIAGHLLGDTAISQIGATAALYGLITNAAFGLNNGLALTVSRNFGADDEQEVKRSVCWMTILSGMTALIMMVGFLIFEQPILLALQVPEDIMKGAAGYLCIILIGIPLTMLYNLEASLLQAVGNSVTPLKFLLFSSVLNVILDIVFMKYIMPDVRGAAIATVLAQGISAILGILFIYQNYPQLHFGRKELHTTPQLVLDMYWTGISMALMSTVYNIGSVVLQSSINALGNVYIAAQIASRRLAEFFYTPGLALGTGIATYSSQNVGAGKTGRIKNGIWTAIMLYGIWWLVAMLFVYTIAPEAVGLITGSSDGRVIQNAVQYLRISIPMVPPMAVLVILRNALQGMKHTISPLICSGLELLGKVVFAWWLVPSFGYIAVCVCEPVTWVICCIFIVSVCFIHKDEFHDMQNVRRNSDEEGSYI